MEYCSQTKHPPSTIVRVAHEALKGALEKGRYIIATRLLQTSGIRAFIAQQHDILPTTVSAFIHGRYSSSHEAAVLAVVYALIDSGADPYGIDDQGQSSLLLASQAGFEQIFDRLLNTEIDLSVCTEAVEISEVCLVTLPGPHKPHVCKILEATLAALVENELYLSASGWWKQNINRAHGYIIQRLLEHQHATTIDNIHLLR